MTTPDPIVPAPEDDTIAQRAADYFQRRRFWGWSDADRAELDAWLAESLLHRVAYLRVEGIAAHAGRIAVHREPAAVARKIAYRRFAIPLLAAASIALFAALGISTLGYLVQPPDRTYSTEIGGRTLLTFADGTQVDLNTDTFVRFRMTGEERTVWLDRGEAWFQVSHDAARPFTVIVGRHRVRDIGTEFVIRRNADRLEVALLAGRASLSTEGAPTATLVPGEDAVATAVSMSVTQKSLRELADELAWRRGELVFRNTKLADAVREFNRYNTTKLVIADPSIAGLTFSADIRDNNLEGFLQLAQTMLNLRAAWQGNDILLSRATKNSGRHAP